jgi:hypothetical protein
MIPAPRDPARARRLARIIIGGGAVAIALVIFVNLSLAYGRPGDVVTYLAAGERLNAGHELYALSEGDRPLLIAPPYFTVPLVSPPLIGAMWRPIALLPEPIAVGGWWIAMLACLATAVAMVLRAPRLIGTVALYVLAVPLGLEAVQGNINALILLGMLVAWRLYQGDRTEVAAAILGALAVLKVTPAVLVVWIVVVAGRRGLVGAAAGIAVATVLSLTGAGLDSHLEYLAILRDPAAVAPTDLSVAGWLRFLGVEWETAARAGFIVTAVGIVGVIAARRRPELSFRIAVVTLVLGTPAVYVNTFLLLLAALAPTLWPRSSVRQTVASPEPALARGA